MTQQRRNHMRRLGLVAVPGLAALVLAGCSGGSSGSSTTGGPQEFSFTYVTSSTVTSPFETIAKQYMAEHPDVTITLNAQPNDQYDQTLRTQLQGGNASDVIETVPGTGQGRSVIPLAEAGLLLPLDDSSAAIVPDQTKPLLQSNGQTYGLPTDITFDGLVVNDTALAAIGLNKFPTDGAALKSACATAASAGKSLFVVAGAIPANTGLASLAIAATRVYADNPNWNQDRADGKVKFANSGWKDVLQELLDLNAAGCFQAGVEGGGFDAITNNQAQGTSIASFIPAPAYAQLASVAPDQKFSVQAFPPATSSGKPFGLASINYTLSISANSKNAAAAQAFLDWMAQPEIAQKFAKDDGGLPVSGLSSVDLSDGAYAGVADIINGGDYVGLPSAEWPNAGVYDALSTGAQGLLTGQQTVDQVLQAMDTAYDQ